MSLWLLKYSLRPKISVSSLVQLCTKASTKLRHIFWDGVTTILYLPIKGLNFDYTIFILFQKKKNSILVIQILVGGSLIMVPTYLGVLVKKNAGDVVQGRGSGGTDHHVNGGLAKGEDGWSGNRSPGMSVRQMYAGSCQSRLKTDWLTRFPNWPI